MNTELLGLCAANLNLIASALIVLNKKEKPKKKYSAKWLLRREDEGFSHKLIREINSEDGKLYRNILRMIPVQKILQKLGPLITKQDTRFRNCIGPVERLQLTLRYLATGETQSSLQLPFRIQQSTISKILKETIPAIYNALNENVLKFP